MSVSTTSTNDPAAGLRVASSRATPASAERDAEAELLSSAAFGDHIAAVAHTWQAALAAEALDTVIVSAGSATYYFRDDQAPPQRVNPHFAQWFPDAAVEHCELVVGGSKPKLLFYQPADFWHQPPSVPAWADAHFDVEVHASLETLSRSREEACAGSNAVAHIGPQPLTDAPSGAQHNPAALLDRLEYARAAKTPFELAAMRAASRRAARGHVAAVDAYTAGGSEFDCYLAYLAAVDNVSAEQPYSAIVAHNAHAGVLHYQHYARARESFAYSFLIDAGANALGYASDVTRTVAGADAPVEFGALIERLDGEQRALIEAITAGTAYPDLQGAMMDRICALLVEAGVLLCGVEEAIDKRLADPFMPHGLGHLLGLQTHDVGGHLAGPDGGVAPPDPRFPALRLTRSLDPNTVITIEPGIYFIPMLLDELRASSAGGLVDWDLIARLLPCGGIRIEDNVRVRTGEAPENFTRDAFDLVAAERA
ncbi:MAG: Xaa-Pro dipeptidase [Pseudomonadota bacterium]